jgi:hypothetical protein
MIPKSGNRFSDKIMLKTKNLAHADVNQAWRTARLPPTSGRAALARGRGQGRRYIICCTAVEMFGQASSRDPRSRGGERMTPRSLPLQFLNVGHLPFARAHAQTIAWSMIRKSGYRFSEQIMLHK